MTQPMRNINNTSNSNISLAKILVSGAPETCQATAKCCPLPNCQSIKLLEIIAPMGVVFRERFHAVC